MIGKVSVNAIKVIHPYLHNGTWVFDDESVGLVKEPFVCGIPEMIDGIVGKCREFTMLFSDKKFPSATHSIEWVRAEDGGNWYHLGDKQGWLCPALFKYFEVAPAEIFIAIKPAEGEKSKPERDTGKEPWSVIDWDYEDGISAIVGAEPTVDSLPICLIDYDNPHEALLLAAPELRRELTSLRDAAWSVIASVGCGTKSAEFEKLLSSTESASRTLTVLDNTEKCKN